MPMGLRPDLAIISTWVRPGSRVLDLGCGDGTLLAYLSEQAGVRGYGLEIDPHQALLAMSKGVDVIQADIDDGLGGFADDSFDYVIMTRALQAVYHPLKLLFEMLRVGRQGIVTFPNYGYWRCRIQFIAKGRMPVSPALPQPWHTTANIHPCTVADFEDLCGAHGVAIMERRMVDERHRQGWWMQWWPNVLGEIALYRLQWRTAAGT